MVMQHVGPLTASVQRIMSHPCHFFLLHEQKKKKILQNLTILINHGGSSLLLSYGCFRQRSLRVLPAVLFVFKGFYLQCLSDVQAVPPERIRFQKHCQIISLHGSVADKPH